MKYVTSFYYQNAIDLATKMSPVRLMPLTMIYTGRSTNKNHLIRSAQYLQRELPIRLAHQISRFRQLPFVAGVHPMILEVHKLYLKSFYRLNEVSKITDLKSELEYCGILRQFLDEHKNDIALLCKGLKEIRYFKSDEAIRKFLDRALNSRIATELLCKHHIALQKENPEIIGIIAVNFSPKLIIEKKIESVRTACEEQHGTCPYFSISGHLDAKFAFIPQPFGNIVQELLYRAAVATVENHKTTSSLPMPPVQITISNNDLDFIIKVSDRGRGLHHAELDKLWEFDLSKQQHHTLCEEEGGYLADELQFGLPVCRTYARCLGGNIEVESMEGFGTDTFLRLGHIEGKRESFRI